jgi:hypothetical protein
LLLRKSFHSISAFQCAPGCRPAQRPRSNTACTSGGSHTSQPAPHRRPLLIQRGHGTMGSGPAIAEAGSTDATSCRSPPTLEVALFPAFHMLKRHIVRRAPHQISSLGAACILHQLTALGAIPSACVLPCCLASHSMLTATHAPPQCSPARAAAAACGWSRWTRSGASASWPRWRSLPAWSRHVFTCSPW